MTPRSTIILLALATCGAGCAYYNGLYNANRLADEARRAEREGRVGEARSLWSRAAVKAESVAARFPNSKWRDDALLLQGTALHNINACTQAVRPLMVAADSSPDSQIRQRARITIGRCRLAMLEPDSVAPAVNPVVAEGDSAARQEALLLRGRAALLQGEYDSALADLAQSAHAEAVFPRAMALVGLGRAAEAGELLLPWTEAPYAEDQWLSTLDSVGQADPVPASLLVDRLMERTGLGTGQRARLALGDGERWLSRNDEERAARRFELAATFAVDSVEGRTGRAHLGVIRMRHLRDPGAVAPLLDTLRMVMERGGMPVRVAGPYVNVLERAAVALEPDTSVSWLFVAAEDVRDSLGVPALAAEMFLEVARRDPASVLAPKALLAAAALQPESVDSLVRLVRQRYPNSVYTLALSGEGGEAYSAVEDSLRVVLDSIPRGRTTSRRR
jgi:tetratricopeptide (TPR) repeat protein